MEKKGNGGKKGQKTHKEKGRSWEEEYSQEEGLELRRLQYEIESEEWKQRK